MKAGSIFLPMELIMEKQLQDNNISLPCDHLMEFTAGPPENGFYIAGDSEKQATDSAAHYSHFPLPSSSTSPATTFPVFGWHVGPSGSGGGGGGDEDAGKGDENFFLQKEHMFDKVVTPSDVGKLNRLVIPKQHAEKYLPLDPAANEKGLLLSFEDRTGKSWRFRYSYWNSSQSYVMTKGWSRFVKDKRLDAGDVVSFGRGLGDAGRDHLYIDWKPRPENHHEIVAANASFGRLPFSPLPGAVSFGRSLDPWGVGGGGGGRFLIPPAVGYDHHHRPGFMYSAMSAGGPTRGDHLLFFGSSAVAPPPPPRPPPHIGVQHEISGHGGRTLVVPNFLPVAGSQAEAKRVRLFGVNLERGRPDDRQIANARSINSALPFFPLPPYMGVEPSVASVASPSAEPHLTLDLGL